MSRAAASLSVDRQSPSRWPCVLLLLGTAAALCCQNVGEAKIVRRILDDHRARAKVKPLPAAGVVRVLLSRREDPAATGTEVLEWDGDNFRETLTSAGLATVHGIQGGKGYFTDEDGVTRIASEPMLAELRTRSYFWRRAYLFDDLERARPALGPSDAASVSIGLTPRGGNALWLVFSRSDGRLLRAHSIHLDLAFETASRFSDTSRRHARVQAEITHIGLPTGSLRDTAVGGWSSHWQAPSAESKLGRAGHDVLITGRLSGLPASIALDGAVDGPLRVKKSLADRLGLTFSTDIFGRSVARGAELSVGALSFPSLSVERVDNLPDQADAAAGGVFFRETIVEVDAAAQRVRFHDPARWVDPEGFFRVLLDDDGNRVVVIARRNGGNVRLLGPTAADVCLRLTPEAAERLGLSGRAPVLSGLWVGPVLPARTVPIEPGPESDYAEDGTLGWDLILDSHADFDLPHRWLYLRPLAGRWR